MSGLIRSSARSLRGLAIAAALGRLLGFSPALALPPDPDHGEKLAKRWCASCHIVSADQTRGGDTAPAFATIAKKPGFDAEKIGVFLMDPHPKMPDMQLTRDEAKDLGAYIASLAK